jgi:hypothetical protein
MTTDTSGKCIEPRLPLYCPELERMLLGGGRGGVKERQRRKLQLRTFHQCDLTDGNYEGTSRCTSKLSVFLLPCPLTTHPRPTTCNISSRHFIRAHTSFYLEFAYSSCRYHRHHQSLPPFAPYQPPPDQPHPMTIVPTPIIYLLFCVPLHILFLTLYTLCIGIFLASVTVYLGFIVCYYDVTPANEVWYLAKRGVIVNE